MKYRFREIVLGRLDREGLKLSKEVRVRVVEIVAAFLEDERREIMKQESYYI